MKHLQSCGHIWKHLEISGNICEHLELWKTKEQTGMDRDQQGTDRKGEGPTVNGQGQTGTDRNREWTGNGQEQTEGTGHRQEPTALPQASSFAWRAAAGCRRRVRQCAPAFATMITSTRNAYASGPPGCSRCFARASFLGCSSLPKYCN